MTDAKRTLIFNAWLAAIGARAVTSRPQDEQRLRQLAGFDELSEDEFDDAQDRIEADRTSAANVNLFTSETAKVVYLTKRAELAKLKKSAANS